MLCITGDETTPQELAARAERIALEKPFAAMPFQEWRLDLLRTWDDSLFSLMARLGQHLLITCRAPSQGGSFQGSDAERWNLLERSIHAGAACVDVEDETPDSVLARLRAARRDLRLVLSFHDFSGMSLNLEQRLERMVARDSDIIKLAVTPRGTADVEALLALRKKAHWKPTLLIGMGPFGTLTRLRYRHFGSPWSYVAATSHQATAPGQFDMEQALRMGLPDSAEAPFLAVLGGDNVRHSRGSLVYNCLFRERGLPYAYGAVVCDDIAAGLRLMEACNAKGAAITMPHKERVMRLVEPDGLASTVGACNTIRFDAEGRRAATNTDVAGVRIPLERHGAMRGDIALVLGAGGAAKAALVACQQLGINVAVATRNPERARQTLPVGTQLVPWDRRADIESDLILNATPLFTRADELWPESLPLKQRIVFDFALGAGESHLLARARAERCTAVTPDEMWRAQGEAQMEFILGQRFDLFIQKPNE
jgi:3-dehydroquinate dehydratase type I